MQDVVEFGALREDRAHEVEVGGEKVVLVRTGDTVRAFAGKCPHAGAPLAKGAVCNGVIVCPWHKAAFRVEDGSMVEPPALEGLARYEAVVEDGRVLVGAKQDAPPLAQAAGDGRVAVLVGAGAASAAAAVGLRGAGWGGDILMIGREPAYDRTALSKFVMSGDKEPFEVPELLDADRMEALRVTRVEGEVVAVDAAGKSVSLADGQTIRYDAALLAPGGAPRPLDVPGADLPFVHTLRRREDAAAILDGLSDTGRAVVIGGSFIGLEVAAGLRKRGLDVTVVTPEAIPFTKQFGERIGRMFRALHESKGVVFRAESKAARIELGQVVLEDGTALRADVVVVGVGVAPATGFVGGVKREEDGGIAVDGSMRAQGSLYAAGDVAAFPLHGARTRIEHWRLAQQHGLVAGRAMAGQQARYEGVPFFWTAHFGKRFEYLGHATEWDDVVIEGDLDGQDFVALLVKDGMVAGALGCARERPMAVLSERMRSSLTAEAALRVVRAG